jgi:hypothetical protein
VAGNQPQPGLMPNGCHGPVPCLVSECERPGRAGKYLTQTGPGSI